MAPSRHRWVFFSKPLAVATAGLAWACSAVGTESNLNILNDNPSWAAIERPSNGFRKLPRGFLVLSKNGLFLIAEENKTPVELIEDLTINAVAPHSGGFLVGTDGGLFHCPMGGDTTYLHRIGRYRRSVRDIFLISDSEYFVATQDGLKYFSGLGSDLQSIGRNVQVDTILGTTDGSQIVCLTDPETEDGDYELGIATGEYVDYHPAPGKIEDAVLYMNKIVVGSDRGLFEVGENGFENCLKKEPVNGLCVFDGHAIVAASDGLFALKMGIDGPLFERLFQGEILGLGWTHSCLLAIGNDGQVLFGGQLEQKLVTSFEGVSRCSKGRAIEGDSFFCTNTGIIHVDQDNGKEWSAKFIPSDVEVFDIVRSLDTLIVGTEKGIGALKVGRADPWKVVTPWIAAFVATAAIFALRDARKPRVFISYRRHDSQTFAERIHERLSQTFKNKRVLMDKSSFQKASDFRREMERAISNTSVVLAVIGEKWLSLLKKDDASSHSDSPDYVIIELEIAKQQGKPVLPVVLRDTVMPKAGELPESIRYITYQGASRVRNQPDFDKDMKELTKELKRFPFRKSTKSSDR